MLKNQIRPKEEIISLRLLGEPGAWFRGGWHGFSADMRYVLLCYLAHAGTWVTRDRLADLFWPDSNTETALSNLRQLVKRVAELEIAEVLERDKYRLRYAVVTDVEKVEAAARVGELATSLSLIGGPFLGDMALSQHPPITAWIEMERGRLLERARTLRLMSAEDLAGAGLYDKAAEALVEVLYNDPLDEEATYYYMRVSVLAERVPQALRAYDRLCDSLRHELSALPSHVTAQFAERIRYGSIAPEQRQQVPAPAEASGLAAAGASTTRANQSQRLWPS